VGLFACIADLVDAGCLATAQPVISFVIQLIEGAVRRPKDDLLKRADNGSIFSYPCPAEEANLKKSSRHSNPGFSIDYGFVSQFDN
jgi:hypothetical protein